MVRVRSGADTDPEPTVEALQARRDLSVAKGRISHAHMPERLTRFRQTFFEDLDSLLSDERDVTGDAVADRGQVGASRSR